MSFRPNGTLAMLRCQQMEAAAMATQNAHKTVIVFAVFPGLTQLALTGAYEVLARLPGSEVIVASIAGGILEGSKLAFAGLRRLADIPACDVICVPGGVGVTEQMHDEEFLSEVRRLAQRARFVTSVCTGSLVLGAAGLLRGKRATSHWAWRDALARFGAIPVPSQVVRDGNVMTGGGVTAGIDFALTLVAELAGGDVAQAIQLQIAYAPSPPFEAGRPDTAPPHVLARVREQSAAMAERREAVIGIAVDRLRVPAA
jgi:cyclohexyl-isocyanide hydratase